MNKIILLLLFTVLPALNAMIQKKVDTAILALDIINASALLATEGFIAKDNLYPAVKNVYVPLVTTATIGAILSHQANYYADGSISLLHPRSPLARCLDGISCINLSHYGILTAQIALARNGSFAQTIAFGTLSSILFSTGIFFGIRALSFTQWQKDMVCKYYDLPKT